MLNTDKVMTVQSVNPHVVEFEYAVRGEIAIRAEEIKAVSGIKSWTSRKVLE